MKRKFDSIWNRYIRGLYLSKDIEQLPSTLDKPESHQWLSDIMDAEWTRSQQQTKPNENDTQYEKEAADLLKRLNKKPRIFALKPYLKYIAVVIGVIIGITAFYRAKTIHESPVVTYSEIRVKNGENRLFYLPDSTEVFMNAGSSIRYPSHFSGERKIELNGEGYFNVKKDPAKPFIITVDNIDIRVLGTSFNVKAYDTDELFYVSVASGKVQVDIENAILFLEADDHLTYDHGNGDFQKRKETIERTASWLKGGLYFDKTPIQTVVNELQRIYDCNITIEADNTHEIFMYGEHENINLESVLNSIKYTTGLQYKMENNNIILFNN